MPHITVDGWDYFYYDSGAGPLDRDRFKRNRSDDSLNRESRSASVIESATHVSDESGFARNRNDHALVFLLHCSNASHKEWLPLIAQLETRYRVIAPDLAGYGKSGRWPASKLYDPLIDCRMLDALAASQDDPVHIAGHSFGAAVGLEYALMAGNRVKSLTIIEPPSFFLLEPAGYAKEAQTMRRWGQIALDAMARGNSRRAAATYMSFWLGRVRWWLLPGKMKAGIYDTMTKTGKEFEQIGSSARVPADYAAVTAATQLILGSRTPHEAKIVSRIIAAAVPNADLRELKGAGHMSPYTHTAAVNRMIVEHIAAHS